MKLQIKRMAYHAARRACTMAVRAAVVAYVLYALIEHMLATHHKHARARR